MTYQQIPDPLPVAWNDTGAAINIAANTTASGAVTSPGGAGTYLFQLTGTWVGTLQVQISVDGVNFVNVTGSGQVLNVATGALMASGNITTTGVYQVNVAGIVAARVITTAYTSGTIVGAAVLTAATPPISPAVTLATTTTVTAIGGASALTAGYVLGKYVNIGATATSINSTLARYYGWHIFNPNASAVYVQMFALAPGSVTLGTTVPNAVLGVPAGGVIERADPYGFPIGILSAAATTGAGNNTGPASTVLMNFYYV